MRCLQPQEMKELGEREYYAVVEGEITRKYKATVPGDIDRQRVKFMQVRCCWHQLRCNISCTTLRQRMRTRFW